MIRFILNNSEIISEVAASVTLLEFIRYQQHLKGTKTGCNEGDCGACTVLVGELQDDAVRYRSFTSCLTPLGNVHGKHVVTVEGINMEGLNPIQQAMHSESGTQCGFCTPGFVVSMAGFCLSGKDASFENARAAVDGNICRCTGYKSIERAAAKLADLMAGNREQPAIEFVTENAILPAYFKDIKGMLEQLRFSLNGNLKAIEEGYWKVAGGTDLYVQKHDDMRDAQVQLIFDEEQLKNIYQQGNSCYIGAACTATDLLESPIMQKTFPNLENYVKLVSSTPIRNMATIAGNFVNASPIGDFTIFFLALNAQLILSDGEKQRELPLREFYKGYKQLNKSAAENIDSIWFELPAANGFFNFEKISKRTHLDIASVNSAFYAEVEHGLFKSVSVSAGGVGPVPAFLKNTSAFLAGKQVSVDTLEEAIEIAMQEVSSISDARGSAEYKRLLLGQLMKAHFVEYAPELLDMVMM